MRIKMSSHDQPLTGKEEVKLPKHPGANESRPDCWGNVVWSASTLIVTLSSPRSRMTTIDELSQYACSHALFAQI